MNVRNVEGLGGEVLLQERRESICVFPLALLSLAKVTPLLAAVCLLPFVELDVAVFTVGLARA